jgi:sugar phosphate isomerase/epimerase
MSIRSSITVSLVPEARGGPFVFQDDLPDACRKARSLGFDAVEVFPPAADAIDPASLKRCLDDNGLALAAVGTGAGWVRHKLTLVMPDPALRSRAREFVRSIIEFAGGFGASAIIGSMQGRSGDGIDAMTAAGYLRDALQDLGEYARQFHVPLVFEPLNRYETNMVNTVEGGLALLESLSSQNVLLLADLFHMNIEEPDIAWSIRTGGNRIGHVHFVDSNRRAAGFGHIDFRPIARALAEIGYNGFASAEVLPLPDPDAAALQTIQAFRELFAISS